MTKYKVYTDGSFKASDNRIGFGAVIPNLQKFLDNQPVTEDDIETLSFTIDYSKLPAEVIANRNVVGELFAVMYTITKLRKINNKCHIEVNYDYTGVEMWAIGKWQPNKLLTNFYTAWYVKNQLYKHVSFNHTKAHNVYKYNNMADMAAKRGFNGVLVPTMDKVRIEDKIKYQLHFNPLGVGEEIVCDFIN